MTRPSKRGHRFARRTPELLALLAAGVLGVVHVYVIGQGDRYAGPLLVVDHIFDAGSVLFLLALCSAVGLRVLTACRVGFDRPLERMLFPTAVGAGAVATLALVLSLTLGARPWVLWLMMLALTVLARRELLESLRTALESGHRLVPVNRDPLMIFGLVVLGGVAAFLLLYATPPPSDWDTLTYHLPVPSDFLSQGRLHVPEDNLHVTRTGLIHFLYLPLLAVQSVSAPALLSAAMALLLAVAMFAFCSRFLIRETAAVSLASFWGTSMFLLVAITPRIDLTLALFLFLAHYGLLMALSSSSRAHFLVAGVLLGFAFGVKFPAGTYILALLPLIVWAARSLDPAPSRMARNLLWFGLLAGLAGVPWLIKNWLLLGAPAYPFLSPRILQPWLVPILGSYHVPASIDPNLFGWEWDLRNTFNLREAFLDPGRLTIEVEGNLYFMNPILLAWPLGLLFTRDRTIRWLLIPGALSLAFILIPFPYSNPRYLIPSLVPLTIVALHSIVLITQRLVDREKSFLILIPVVLATLLPTVFSMFVWMTQVNPVPYLIGTASKKQFLENHVFLEEHTQLVDLVNSELPTESRILLLYEARSYYFERQVLQDNLWTNWPLLASTLDQDPCLETTGLTHVVINKGAVSYLVDGGMDLDLVEWPQWEVFRDRCLTLMHEDQVYELYRFGVESPR
jgi:hypothetical protein